MATTEKTMKERNNQPTIANRSLKCNVPTKMTFKDKIKNRQN